MRRTRFLRTLPLIEIVALLFVTLVVTYVTVTLQLTDRVHLVEGAAGIGTDIADFGPGLLVLSSGLGMLSFRHWRESEIARTGIARARDELFHSEARYRSLIDVSPDPVMVVTDMRIRFVNPAAIAFFGAGAAADLVDRSVVDVFPPDEHVGVAAWFAQVLASDDPPAPLEQRMLRLDGASIDAETALVRTDFEGRPALQAVVRDMSARKAADEAITRYQALAENTQEIVFFSTPDGRILDCNRAATLRYGYTSRQLKSMTLADLHLQVAPAAVEPGAASAPGDMARFDAVHVLEDGSTIELSVTAQIVVMGEAEIVVSVCRDVTSKRAAERELRGSEARYRSLTELSPSPVVVYGADHAVLFANQALLDLVRARDASQVIGHDARDFVHPDSIDCTRLSLETLVERDATPFSDMRIIRCDGTSVAVQMATSRTVFDGADAYHAVLQDVSYLTDVADRMRRTTEDTISAMARLAETRDPYTSGHQARVAAIACRIAERMGLEQSTRDAIRLAGIVHDIGKMSIPAEILSRPGKLTDLEFALIKEHAQRGYELLLPIDFPWPIAEIVREHHERIDGSGYPRGISDGDICIEARVLAVADTMEAVSSDRPYRPSRGRDMAIQIVREGRGTLYDADCVDAALSLADANALFEPSEA